MAGRDTDIEVGVEQIQSWGIASGDEGELCGVEEHAQRGELRSLADEVQKTAIAHVDSSDAAFEHVLSGRAAGGLRVARAQQGQFALVGKRASQQII